MEESEVGMVWGWLLVGCRGWLGPWVALAGLINEGMEEGEVGAFWGGLWWATGAAWGRGSLWPDLLMKGWRRVKLGRSGAGFGGLQGLAGAGGRFGRTY